MKSKTFIVVLFSMAFSFAVQAQQTKFSKVFGRNTDPAEGCAAVQSSDMNFIVAGSRNSKAEALLFKIDQAGTILWENKFSFPGSWNTSVSRIIPTYDACFISVGNMNDDNMFCMKTNTNGDTLWCKSINLGSQEYANSVIQTDDKGILIAGTSTQGATPPYYKIVLVKLDSSGSLKWANQLTHGTFATKASAVKQTPDGGFIMIGTTQNNNSTESAILVKLTSGGNVSWAKKMVYPPFMYSVGFDLAITNSGYLLYTDIWDKGAILIKTDFSGNYIWSRYYFTGSIGYGDYQPAPTLQHTHDGGFAFVTTGYFGNAIKIDSNGYIQWARELRLDVLDLIESADHGFLAIGNGPIWGVKKSGMWGYQIGLIKTDSLGNSVECVQTSSDYSDTCTLGLNPVTAVSTVSSAVVTSLHPVISSAMLSAFYGCIDVTGGIDDQNNHPADLVVFPNPVDESFSIKFNHPNKTDFSRLEIYNILGEKVFQSFDAQMLNRAVKTSVQTEGIYTVCVVCRDKTYSAKFLIRH
jgi:hypothetical protein